MATRHQHARKSNPNFIDTDKKLFYHVDTMSMTFGGSLAGGLTAAKRHAEKQTTSKNLLSYEVTFNTKTKKYEIDKA